MKKLRVPRVLELDYKVWRCGMVGKNSLGQGLTFLLNDEGYMCCLGQFCKQSGAQIGDLLGHERPCQIVNPPNLFGYDFKDSSLGKNVMIVNDDMRTSVAEKVVQLRKLFKRHKKEIVLKNFPKKVLKEIDKLQS